MQTTSEHDVHRVITYAELRAAGHSRRRIERGVARGELVRLRKGSYVLAGTAPESMRAARLGGRLDCLSLLALLGVFVHRTTGLHIVVRQGSSRLGRVPRGVVRHWRRGSSGHRDIVEALAQACRCQEPRAAVATLDSARNKRLISEDELEAVFDILPARFRVLRGLIDARAEAGTETFVRLMLRRLRVAFEVQAKIHGVGRVDLLVDGWLIVECDSREFHGTWTTRRKDYRRDLAAASLGYWTLRLNAEDILFDADAVFAALRTAVSCRPRVHNSSRMRARGATRSN